MTTRLLGLVCIVCCAFAAAVWLVPLAGSGFADREPDEPVGQGAIAERVAATTNPAAGAGSSRVAASRGQLVHAKLEQRGRAVVGATVLACRGSLREPAELHSTKTDEDGVFELPPFDERCWFAVLSEAAPRNWILTGFEPTPAHESAIVAEVPLPGRIEGFVLDARGSPVAGAEVTCFVPSVMRFGGGAAPLGTKSGLDGRFAFAQLHEGQHHLQCVCDGFADVRAQSVDVAEGEVASAVLELTHGSPVHGVVLDWRGVPLSGAAVDAGHERIVTTDEAGRFAFASLGTGCSLRIRAHGHLLGHASTPELAGRPVRVRMQRAATLRGVVRGAEGWSGTVELVGAKSHEADLPDPWPYELLDRPLDVVRDGVFEVDGLSCSDYDLTIRIPGLGTVGPARIALREDAEKVFELVPGREIVIAVQDEEGRPVAGAQLLHFEECRDEAARFESYPAELMLRSILRDDVASLSRGRDSKAHAAKDGEVRLWLGEQDGFICVVRAPGFADVARALQGSHVIDRLVVRMSRVGSLRGVVTERAHAGYARYVEVWPADEEFVDRSDPWFRMHGLPVKRSGEFSDLKVMPGSYQAALRRTGYRHAKKRSRGTPLIDEGTDLGGIVAFQVVAGEETEVALPETRLGVLRGKVLLHGAPAPGVAVMATRVGWKPDTAAQLLGRGSWDEEVVWRDAPGQLTRQDGSFRMLYRDAGPVELRVRHPDGHATAAPVTVVLPPPGEDVVTNLHVGAGAIRGRLPVKNLASPDELVFTLYSLRLAATDALRTPSGLSALSLSYYRPSVKGNGGAFEFAYLPDGAYVIRAQQSAHSDGCLWQTLVEVHGHTVDLGDISLPQRVDVVVPFTWSDSPPAEDNTRLDACWLWQAHGGNSQAVWVATVGASKGLIVCGEIVPGRYTAAIGGSSIRTIVYLDGLRSSPKQFSKPVTFEVRSDGSIEPSSLVFTPQLPAPPGPPSTAK